MNQVEVKRKQIQFFSDCLTYIVLWIFAGKIQNNGVAYLCGALLVFSLFWILTGKNLPDRMGRVLRGRNAKGQYRNVSRMRKNLMVFECIEGLTASLLYATLGWLVVERLFQMPYSGMIVWILAPALFLRCVQAVFLGYFQSEGSELPTAVSCVLRQVFYLGFGLVFQGILGTYGEKVSLLLRRDDFTSMYGAMGIAVGMVLSELLILLFLFLIYRGSMSGRKEREQGQGMKGTDSFASQIRIILTGMGTDILSQLLGLLVLWMGVILFQKSVDDVYASVDSIGVFFGKYLPLLLLPAALIKAGLLSGIARTGSHLRKEEMRYAKTVFQAGTQGVFLHGFFFTVFFAVMAEPFAQLFGGNVQIALSEMLQKGSSLILWGLLVFYLSSVLQMAGSAQIALAGYGIFVVAGIASLLLWLDVAKSGIVSLALACVLGTAVGAVVMLVLTCLKLGTWPDWLRTLAIPAGCSLACGLLGFGLEKVLLPHLGALVTVLVSLVIMLVVYWFLLVMLRCFRGQELNYIPGGRLIRTLGGALHIL